MKPLIHFLAFSLVVLISACSSELVNEPAESKDELVSFENKGLPLALKNALPENIEVLPEISFNEQFGYFEVHINGELSFILSEDQLSIEDVKSELSNDQLFTYKYYDQGENSLLYQAILPDGTEYMYHYVKTIEVNQRKFVMRSEHDAEHTLRSIKLLKSVINNIVPIKQT